MSVSMHLPPPFSQLEHPVLSSFSLTFTLPVTIETTVAWRETWMVVSNEDTGYMCTHYHTAEFTASPLSFEKLSDVIQGHVMQLSTQRGTICRCQSSNLLVITGGFNFRLALFLSLYSSVHKAVSMYVSWYLYQSSWPLVPNPALTDLVSFIEILVSCVKTFVFPAEPHYWSLTHKKEMTKQLTFKNIT